MEADGFRDRNQRYTFLVARENARRLMLDPAVLEAGRRHLERFSAGDSHQRHGYALWSALLDAGAAAVAARLTERGERGDAARETAPSFGGLPGPVRARLLAEARMPPIRQPMPSHDEAVLPSSRVGQNRSGAAPPAPLSRD